NHIKLPGSANTNGKTEPYPVSKIREALPQFFAVGAKNLLLLTFGTTLGFSTILIPALSTNPSYTVEEISWIGSINLFMVPLGGFVSGPVSQRLGRRLTMMLTTIPFVFAWLMFYNASSINMLFLAMGVTGFTGGLLEAPVLTYVAEVTQPHLRGLLSATSTMAVICGTFSQVLARRFVEWRTVALINIVYPLICFTALYMVPESPTWLAGKGRLSDAEKALCWLRGWVTPDHVKGEFRGLCESIQRPINVMTINSIILESPVTTKPEQQPTKKTWHMYLQRTFYLPFILVTLVFFINAFGGIMVLQIYAVLILEKLNTPIDKYTATAVMGISQVLGTIICVCIIHFTGKRKLSFFSVFPTGVCLLMISIFGHLVEQGKIDGVAYSWFPTTLLVGAAFFSHICLKTLPWILAGEVFPAEVRSVATGSAGSIGYIFSSIASYLFPHMNASVGLPATLLIYALVNIGGVICLYFMLPETEGRTLKEIEEHYAGINRLEDRPSKDKVAGKEIWAISNPQPVKDDIESRL
ncbi:hypothetical protein QAD02_008619, partial [Eretmocerus hayati]